MSALAMAYFVGRFLNRPLKPRNEQQQDRGYGDCHECKIAIEPEHQTDHPDDRQEIDQNAQGRRRGKVFYRLNVIGNGAEQRAGLVAVVVGQRKALKMVIRPHAEVMRHPLAHAFGVVVVDVGSERANHRDQHRSERRYRGDSHFAGAQSSSHRAYKVIEPFGKMMRSDDIVENYFQRPRPGEAHQRLDQHGQ